MYKAILQDGSVTFKIGCISLVPRLLPYRKTEREPERSDHVPRDILCAVLCLVLIIELLPTQYVLYIIIVVLDPWMSLRLHMSTGRLFHSSW